MSRRDQVLFVHIPKCAGSSFRSYLNKLADKAGLPIEERYIPGENGLSHSINIEDFNSAQLHDFYNLPLSLIAMHALYGLHHNFASSLYPVYLTFLRDPLDRFISHYNHFQFRLGQDNCKGIPLSQLDKDKAVSVIRKLSNLMCRYIAGGEWKQLNEKDLFFQAFDNLLLRFTAFGFVEDLELSLKEIHQVLPSWLNTSDKVKFPTVNKGNYLSDEIPDWLESLFNSYNESDIKLYLAAKKNRTYQMKLS